jgi:hypothetical protein
LLVAARSFAATAHILQQAALYEQADDICGNGEQVGLSTNDLDASQRHGDNCCCD